MSKRLKENMLIIILSIFMVPVFALGVYQTFLKQYLEERQNAKKQEYYEPEVLADLAYDVNEKSGYTIYIQEESGYQPYLVLTDNYDDGGNVLLLRKHILDEYHPLNIDSMKTAYYENSYLDQFLNGEYYETLLSDVQREVRTSDVEIYARTAWGRNGRDLPETTRIRRKVFILSTTEVAPDSTSMDIEEGETLKYFADDSERIVVKDSEGNANLWRLRTPDISEHTVSIVISDLRRLSSIYMEDPSGVRPAFCLDGNLKVVQNGEVVKGEKVYVLEGSIHEQGEIKTL